MYFLSFCIHFHKLFFVFCIHFQKKPMVSAPSHMVDTPERNRYLEKSLLYSTQAFLWVVSSLTPEFIFAPAEMNFFLSRTIAPAEIIFSRHFFPARLAPPPAGFFFGARGTSVPVERHGGPRYPPPALPRVEFRTHARTVLKFYTLD